MAIIQLPLPVAANTGVIPNIKTMATTDNLATLTAAGYLNQYNLDGYPVGKDDELHIKYNYNQVTQEGDLGVFKVTVNNGVITLVEDTTTSSVTFTSPSVANHFAVFTNTAGNISQDNANAINVGNIQAGNNGNAGHFVSFPAGSNSGSLVLTASSNNGNFTTTITNAPMGQATAFTLPNPSTASAEVLVAPAALVNGNLVQASGTAGLVADAGTAVSALQTKASIVAETSGSLTSGVGPYTFSVAGLTATSVVTASIKTQTNAATLIKVTPGTNQLTLLFSADPGTATVSYIGFIAPQ